jgi:uncharacterized protein (TIGR00255 family)
MTEHRLKNAAPSTQRNIQSMTGSATEHLNSAALSLQIEFKSVNSRFLELNFKLADEVRQLEPMLRERLLSTFLRGKIECKIGLRLTSASSAQTSTLAIDVVQTLQRMEREILALLPAATPLSVAEVLRWPGVLPETSLPSDIETACLTLADQAILKLSAARESEGRNLSDFIVERLNGIQSLTDAIKQRSPELMAAHEQKLLERLNATLGKAEVLNQHIAREETMARIRQEITLYGIKIDVAEEISRLESHLKECRAILRKPGPCGKRLDFMVQELNREANTLASKSVAIGLSQTAVDLKVLIEQIREQIQNLE